MRTPYLATKPFVFAGFYPLVPSEYEKLKKSLEKIIHPEVKKKMHSLIKFHQRKKHSLIFLDIPLLFEFGLDRICDHTLCIAASQNQQMQRLQKNQRMTRKQALSRIRAQMPLKMKIKKADSVIWNEGNKKELSQKVKLWLRLLYHDLNLAMYNYN